MFILGLLLAPVVYLIMHKLHTIEENHLEYELQEINNISYALSIALMRIRDGKNKGVNPDGTLNSLVNEMKRLCELEAIQKQKENNKVNNNKKNNEDNNNNNNIVSVITKSNSSSSSSSTNNNEENVNTNNNYNNDDTNQIEISFEIEHSNFDDSLPNERLLSNQQLMIFNT